MEAVKSEKQELAWWEGLVSLPAVKQLGLMFGLAASVALGFAVVMWAQTPAYNVLYSSLTNADIAAVVEALEQRGIKYRLDNVSGAITVPAGRVHEVRLQLAGDGLPRSAGVGFDILERKQEFGTSQFIQSARYQHALEGELARSISSLASVQSARVHLALPKQSVFVRNRREPSASVLVNLYPGRSLEPGQVAAVAHLVAASIADMEPERVTVVDQRGRMLSSGNRDARAAVNEEQFEHTRKLEERYITRIENILTPVLGRDGLRAQVVLDVDYSVVEQTSETFNPDLPALRSEQVFEQESRGEEMAGIPGALTNQPPGLAQVPEVAAFDAENGAGAPLRRIRRSTSNFELDRTISHTQFANGRLQRLSVAVVVDDRLVLNDEGQLVRVPRTADELERITALVQDAVGFTPQRGDTVNVVNAAFADDAPLAPLPDLPLWEQAWVWELAKPVIGLLVVAIIVLGLLRPVLRALASSGKPVTGEGEHLALENLSEDQLLLSGRKGATGGTELLQLPQSDQNYEQNLEFAREMAMQDPKRVAQVVRSWISADEN